MDMRVYLIRNTVNGKLYVGQTVMTVERRFKAHVNAYNYPKRRYIPLISRALHKYSPENFTYEILEECSSQDHLNEAEIRWIAFYDSIAPNGYNVESGGGQAPVAESTKAKLRGRKRSEATKEKLRNVKRSEATRAKLREVARHRVTNQKQLDALTRGREVRWGTESRARNPSHGESNPNARLTAEEVREIRRLYATGNYSQTELAESFKTKQVTISAITRRRIWAHLQ